MTPTVPPSPAQGETAGVSEPKPTKMICDAGFEYDVYHAADYEALRQQLAELRRRIGLPVGVLCDRLDYAEQQLADKTTAYETERDSASFLREQLAAREAECRVKELRRLHAFAHQLADIDHEVERLNAENAAMRVAMTFARDQLGGMSPADVADKAKRRRVTEAYCKLDWHLATPEPQRKKVGCEHEYAALDTHPGFACFKCGAALAPTSQPSRGKCETCDGTGFVPCIVGTHTTAAGVGEKECERCGGTGKVQDVVDSVDPEWSQGVEYPCPDCAQPERQGADERIAARADEIMRHDYPKLREFFSRYALGSLMRPSCLVCGKPPEDWPPAIQHAELPDVVVCFPCRDAALRPSPPPTDDIATLAMLEAVQRQPQAFSPESLREIARRAIAALKGEGK